MRMLYTTAFLVSLGASAFAQSSNEFGPDGAYLTRPVREALAKARATEFAKVATSAGFTHEETQLVATGLREGKIRLATTTCCANTTGASPWHLTYSTPKGTVTTTTAQQVGLIERTMQMTPYASFFEKYAIIHIAVTPAPPRDYKVVINGEDCRPTEKSIYKVLPGKSSVAVNRSGKPPCAWAGEIGSGKQQDIACNL